MQNRTFGTITPAVKIIALDRIGKDHLGEKAFTVSYLLK